MDIDIRDLLTHDRILTLTCKVLLPFRDECIITIPLPKDAPDCSFLEGAGMVTIRMDGEVTPLEIQNVNLTITTFEKKQRQRKGKRLFEIISRFHERMERDPRLLTRKPGPSSSKE